MSVRAGWWRGLAVGLVAALVVAWTWTRARLEAGPILPPGAVATAAVGQGFGGMGFGVPGAGSPMENAPAPRVYMSTPITAKAAHVWAALSKPIDMSFSSETPLEDVLKYIRSQTEGPELKSGIPFYLDPAGLQEVDKTPSSPVILQLENIPVATGLSLILKQLDLDYYVSGDGIVMIGAAGGEGMAEPSLLILDELAALRCEVTALRNEVAALRGQAPAPAQGSGPSAKPTGRGFRSAR